MIELQKYIVAELKKIHPRVYQEVNNSTEKIFPYVIYRFPTSNEVVDYREDFVLEIDVWDRPEDGSTVMLQTIADNIDRTLNRARYTSDDGTWSTRIYRINRLMIPDPDPLIRRRQLRYELRTYQGGM